MIVQISSCVGSDAGTFTLYCIISICCSSKLFSQEGRKENSRGEQLKCPVWVKNNC